VRALLGRVPVQGGRVTVDGVAAALISRRDLARRVAVVSQREEPAFPLAVRDYVALGRFPWQRAWSPLSREDHDAVEHALRAADVTVLAPAAPTRCQGEWQRVRVARARAGTDAIVDRPDVLDIAHEMACLSCWPRSRALVGASSSSVTNSTSSHASPTASSSSRAESWSPRGRLTTSCAARRSNAFTSGRS
jgi:ABC-type cobalamin/Fe3+-siderophores transport system ATPase subunit